MSTERNLKMIDFIFGLIVGVIICDWAKLRIESTAGKKLVKATKKASNVLSNYKVKYEKI